MACTQSGIKINTFMLGADFTGKGLSISQLNTGRVFYTSPDQIGNYIVVDYIATSASAGLTTTHPRPILDFRLPRVE